jgi:hydroxymethylbilane synthase
MARNAAQATRMTIRLRVGTRGSALALWQADHVLAQLRARWPAVEAERVVCSTSGDRWVDTAPARTGEQGLFTSELEAALRSGAIDLAVHSLKDLPTLRTDGITIGAILARADPRDALLSLTRQTLTTLPPAARIGTCSVRRRAQLLDLRPDVRVDDLRGNVPTRIERLERGEFDAIVLAQAGLLRLGLTHHVSEILGPDRMMPAVGQGAIAIQTREGDARLEGWLAELDDRATRLAATAERAMLAQLQGGCQVPVGALGTFEGRLLTLRAIVADPDGLEVIRQTLSGPVDAETAAEALGRDLGGRLVAAGAGAILERVRATRRWPADPRS